MRGNTRFHPEQAGAASQGRQEPRSARPPRLRVAASPRGQADGAASPRVTAAHLTQAEGADLPCARAASASVAVQWEVQASGAAAGRAVSSMGSPEGKEPGTNSSPGNRPLVPGTAPSGRAEARRGRMTQGAARADSVQPGEGPPPPAGCRVDFRFLYQALISGLGGNGRAEGTSTGSNIL